MESSSHTTLSIGTEYWGSQLFSHGVPGPFRFRLDDAHGLIINMVLLASPSGMLVFSAGVFQQRTADVFWQQLPQAAPR
jgi:hypothetical protein